MTLDPKDELTRQWLQVAVDDLSLAELANSADPPKALDAARDALAFVLACLPSTVHP